MDRVCDDCRNYWATQTQSEKIKEKVLHHAVAIRHDKCTEELIKAGANVNWTNDSSFTTLMTAAKDGYVDGVHRLIQAGADVNQRDKDDYTALILAGFGGHYECMELLLKADADINARGTSANTNYETALHAAVSSNNIRCVELLINSGADVNMDTSYDTPEANAKFSFGGLSSVLSLACWHGYNDIVELLLKRGANVNETYRRRTGLLEASKRRHYNTMELLIKAGADVNAECVILGKCETALTAAAGCGFFEGVDLLIRSGADVNKVPAYENSPLMKASGCHINSGGAPSHYLKCLELLVQAGADVNATNEDTVSALHVATSYGFSEGVHFLLRRGADVNIQSRYRKKTPLMEAVAGGQVTCAKYLLDAGANVNSMNSEGCTALMCTDPSNDSWAEELIEKVDYVECAKLLLRSGAKINILNRDSRNALQQQVALCYGSQCADLCLLLFAAGETLGGTTVPKTLDCFKFDDMKMVLKHICREAIRKRLLNLDLHTHLFSLIPQLHLPSSLTKYLLYEMPML